MELSTSDIQIQKPSKEKALIRRRNQLVDQLNSLKKSLIVPRSLAAAIIGASAGSIYGPLAASAGGIGGFLLGRARELSENDKEIIRHKIAGIQRELQGVNAQLSTNKKLSKGMLSADDLKQINFSTYKFLKKWNDFMGNPSKPFHAMVFGRPKNGKSIFSFQLADYLSTLGPTLYIASEEGFGGTLKQKEREYILSRGKLSFSDAKGFDRIKKDCRGFEFVFIDSINYAGITVEQVEGLKTIFPYTSFITIQQATKAGQFRGSQEYAHNCDIIIEVIDGVAYQTGRFQAASEFQVWEQTDKTE